MDPMQAEWTLALALTALLLASVLLAVRLLGGRLSDAALGALLCAPIILYWGSFSLVFGYGFGFAALAFAAGHLSTGRAVHALAFMAAALVACASNIQVAVPLVAAAFGGIAGAVGWRWLRGRGFVLPRPYLTLALAVLPVVVWALAYKLRVPDGQIGRGA
jgi:hypothetical protein